MPATRIARTMPQRRHTLILLRDPRQSALLQVEWAKSHADVAKILVRMLRVYPKSLGRRCGIGYFVPCVGGTPGHIAHLLWYGRPRSEVVTDRMVEQSSYYELDMPIDGKEPVISVFSQYGSKRATAVMPISAFVSAYLPRTLELDAASVEKLNERRLKARARQRRRREQARVDAETKAKRTRKYEPVPDFVNPPPLTPEERADALAALEQGRRRHIR